MINIKKPKIYTPDEMLDKFLKWFDFRKRIAFITVILVGIITHLTMITEMIMSQDGLWNSIAYSRAGTWELTLGRWGIELIERLNSFIAIPTISTISCIITMAVTAVILVELFDLKSKISIIFTSAMLVLTPTFTATVLYIYTSFAYCFNMMLSTLVILFLYKFKNKKLGFILASICFMFSLSIYQSYIGITIGLCLMISIIYILRNEKNLKEIFKSILITALSVIIGGVMYYVVTIILLKFSRLEFAQYKGLENISILEILLNLKFSIIQTYKDFAMFFFGDEIVYNSNYKREIYYFIFFIAFTISSIIAMFSIKGDKKDKIIKIALVILGLIILPISLNIIDILVNESAMYALTAVQMILMIPFAFAIFEIENKGILIKWLAIISCICIMWTYYMADNTSYATLKLTYNQAYSTTMRIMDRIENTTNYTKDTPILFGGIVGNNNYPRTSNIYSYTIGSIVNNVVFHGTYGGQLGTWQSFIRIFYGMDITFCNENVYRAIVTGEEYKKMEIFPSPNSVKVMDGIVVVKLSEDPPLTY